MYIAAAADRGLVQFESFQRPGCMFAECEIDRGAHVLVWHTSDCVQEILVVSDITNTEQAAGCGVDRNDAIVAIDNHRPSKNAAVSR